MAGGKRRNGVKRFWKSIKKTQSNLSGGGGDKQKKRKNGNESDWRGSRKKNKTGEGKGGREKIE